MLKAIDSSRQQPLARLINALGIRGVGEVMAQDLTAVYHSLDQLEKASLEELQQIEGVGPNIAEAIVDWFAREANRTVLEKLKAAGVWPVMAEHAGQTGRQRGAGRADICGDRNPADLFAGRGQGIDPGTRRQGDRFGQQEDQLPGGR